MNYNRLSSQFIVKREKYPFQLNDFMMLGGCNRSKSTVPAGGLAFPNTFSNKNPIYIVVYGFPLQFILIIYDGHNNVGTIQFFYVEGIKHDFTPIKFTVM